MKKTFIILIMLLANHFVFCQWSTNPAINNAICTNYYNQSDIIMISDGSGGAIISWNDVRNGLNGIFNDNIYAQRINSNGTVLWTADGVNITPANVYRGRHSLTSDGAGGAFISWVTDGSFGSLYMQHINAAGALQWGANGILIRSGTVLDAAVPQLIVDGTGGSIIVWSDNRDFNDPDLYAQKINAAGQLQWNVNGNIVCGNNGGHGDVQIKSDGSGGAVFAWVDTRNQSIQEIYAQKVDAAGSLQWLPDGVLVNSVVNGSTNPQLIYDGSGAIITWRDLRLGNTDWNIYAQKLNINGQIQWTINGEPVTIALGNQGDPQLTTDGNGGAIFTWDMQSSSDIYAQRINASGAAQWVLNGIAVCIAANGQRLPTLTSDGSGGAVITWQDARTNNIHDIYAQRINSSGTSLWTNDGVAVSTATFVQREPVILNDGINGMIITWRDYRNDLAGNRADIYAQRLNADGSLGGVAVVDLDGDGYTVAQGDCNDNNATIHPGAIEVCNGVDDDCDGLIDEGFDIDGDGYTTCGSGRGIGNPYGSPLASFIDCNDNNAAIHPGATELCNGVDDDCDGTIDEGFDIDGDGYTTCGSGRGIGNPYGSPLASFIDCNDNNAAIHPGATELCNGIDDDCDGTIDEGCSVTISVADVTVYEAGGLAIIPVSLSAASASTITVKYTTSNGSARHPKDYNRISETITFSPGQTSKEISVVIFADAITEGDEDFFITLSRPTNATIADGSATVTITETASFTKTNNKAATEIKIRNEINLVVPNPQRRTEQLRFYGIESGTFDVIIYDLNGKPVYRQLNYRNNWIPIQLPQGIYMYQLQFKKLSGVLKRITGKLLITE